MEHVDFWDRRQINKEGGEPAAEEEQIIMARDMDGGQIGAHGESLLFDIKGQLVELNVTMGTIGELFGKYLETLPEKEE